jgi:hypothetical protein
MRSRGIAAITAALFVACGMLAMRHEAATAHIRNRAGGFVHARALTGHHTGGESDIHRQRNPGADAGDCALLTAFHQAASAEIAPPAVAAPLSTQCADDTPGRARTAHWREVYRIAPKTSPPAAA